GYSHGAAEILGSIRQALSQAKPGGTRVVSASRRRRNRVDGRRAQKIEIFIPPSICTPGRQRRVHTQDIHYFAGYYIARSSNIPPISTGKLVKSGVWSFEGHFVESESCDSRWRRLLWLACLVVSV